MILLVLFLLPLLVSSSSAPVTWTSSTLIQTLTTSVYTSSTILSGNYSYTRPFTSPFTAPPQAGVVLSQVTQDANVNASMVINSVSTSAISINWYIDFKIPNTFALVSVCYIAIDTSIAYVSFFVSSILDSDYIAYPTPRSTGSTNFVVGYLVGFTISSSALGTGPFMVGVSANLFNLTHCVVNITQSNLTYFVNYSTTVGVVLVENSLALTKKLHYFDYDQGYLALGSSSTHSSFVYSSVSTLFAGINGFNIPYGLPLSFNFNPATLTLGSPSLFTTLQVGILNIRLRSCPVATPHFMESNLTCYDVCPDGYYSFPSLYYCALCDYTCLTCTDAINCITCDLTSHRYLKVIGNTAGVDFGQCLCLSYFFDDSANPIKSVVCLSCHYSCQNCYNPTSSGCLVCNVLDHRFLSFVSTVNNTAGTQMGQCQCGPGYFDSGVSICSKCNYTCITCTNLYTCLTCPPHRVLNPITHACDCVVGYVDYGSPVCEKQLNFKVTSSIIYFSFLVFLFFFIVDKFKIQHMEGVWIVQLSFFFSSTLWTDSAFSPFTALAPIVNGFNRLTNIEFDTLAPAPQLQALGIKSIFLGNANIMPALVLGIFLVGFLIWVINRLLLTLPQQFLTISNYFMTDGVFSLVLFNSLNVFFSLGAQVSQFISGSHFTLSSIVLNWIYISVLCLMQGWISYQYLVHYDKFTIVNESLKKDKANIRHPLIVVSVRVVEGFSLGVGYNWVIIPLEIFILEFALGVYLVIKRPYKSKVDTASSIINHMVILAILLLMIFQGQGMFVSAESRTLVIWFQTGLVVLAAVKTMVLFYFKTFKHYMSHRYDKMPEVKMEGLKVENIPDEREITMENFVNNESAISDYDFGVMRRKGTL